ncbi:MAG: type II secretion system F family protein [Kiritimatiellae bacterium]|nr:type II secretion system F family protein [Kiritimatiellia bacterium]
MATFQYIAMDAQGKEQKGTVDAADRAQAIAAVRAAGLFPSAIGEVKSAAPAAAGKKPAAKKAAAPAKRGGALNKDIKINIKMPSFLQGRVKPKDLTTFTRQLATLVNAGLPLMRCIEVLKKQNQIPAMGACLNGISESISGGGTFSEALTAYPKIFDNLYVNMVKAGEAGGVLEVVLNRLAEFAEKAQKIKNKVKGAMIYPSVVLLAAIGITAFLLTTVIPKFKQVFSDILGDAALPAVTEFVMGVSDFVQNNGLQIAAGVGALIVIYKVIGHTKGGAYFLDVMRLKVPVTGTLVKRTAVSQVTRTLGTLLASGVPILQALQIVRDTAGNRVIANALQTVHDAVKEGESMTDPLAASGVFPPMVVSMVQVGEETGALADMLTRIANTYDDEVDNAVAGLTAAIEPALIIFLAVVVGTIVIAMFLPMIKIISSVSGAGAGM